MKVKRILSYILILAMLFSLSTPAFAALREDPNAACGISSHIPPSNYRYVGCTTGDSFLEATGASIGANVVGFIPGLGTLMFVLTTGVLLSGVIDYLQTGILYGRYYKYQWSDGSNSWYHIVWVSDYDNDGYDEYVTCKVVIS